MFLFFEAKAPLELYQLRCRISNCHFYLSFLLSFLASPLPFGCGDSSFWSPASSTVIDELCEVSDPHPLSRISGSDLIFLPDLNQDDDAWRFEAHPWVGAAAPLWSKASAAGRPDATPLQVESYLLLWDAGVCEAWQAQQGH